MSGRDLNGDYAICTTEPGDGDGVNFINVRWGYDSEEQAKNSLKKVTLEENIPEDELVVIKICN